MCLKLHLLVVLVVASVKSSVLYREPAGPESYPIERGLHYNKPLSPSRYLDYAAAWEPRTYSHQGMNKRKEIFGSRLDNDHYSGDVLTKTVHNLQNSGLKGMSESKGNHATAIGSSGAQDYTGHTSGRGIQSEGGVTSGNIQHYGTAGNGGYDGFGSTAYKKGQSTSGFHKSYNNEESGKDSKYVDEDLKVGGETFGKSFGDKFGHATKEGYGEGVRGYGYDRAVTGSGAANSVLHSSGDHDVGYRQHDRNGAYNKENKLRGSLHAGSDHDKYHKAAQALSSVDYNVGVAHNEPFYYV